MKPAFVSSSMFALDEGRVAESQHWFRVLNTNPAAIRLYARHYSSTKDEDCLEKWMRYGIGGPGEKINLINAEETALFVWRREEFRRDCQEGINCAVFRNESDVLSSLLIIEAMEIAWRKWPMQRLFTFVDALKTRRKRDPGRCYTKAGWNHCGRSQGGLYIMEVKP